MGFGARRPTPTETRQPPLDRRNHRRFAFVLDLQYRLLSGRSGRGELVNISSGGLLFRCGAVLPPGELIEVELAWPSPLDAAQPLRLCIHGFIVRSDSSGTALTIGKYEFRGG